MQGGVVGLLKGSALASFALPAPDMPSAAPVPTPSPELPAMTPKTCESMPPAVEQVQGPDPRKDGSEERKTLLSPTEPRNAPDSGPAPEQGSIVEPFAQELTGSRPLQALEALAGMPGPPSPVAAGMETGMCREVNQRPERFDMHSQLAHVGGEGEQGDPARSSDGCRTEMPSPGLETPSVPSNPAVEDAPISTPANHPISNCVQHADGIDRQCPSMLDSHVPATCRSKAMTGPSSEGASHSPDVLDSSTEEILDVQGAGSSVVGQLRRDTIQSLGPLG